MLSPTVVVTPEPDTGAVLLTVAPPPRRENLVPNPRPTSTTGWRLAGGGTSGWSPASDGYVWAATTGTSPPLIDSSASFGAAQGLAEGGWIAVSVDVRALQNTVAQSMNVRVNSYDGAATTDVGAGLAEPVPVNVWTRITMTAQVTALPPGGYVRTLIWPNTGPGEVHVRRMVVCVAPTEAGALAAVSEFFEGVEASSPVVSLRRSDIAGRRPVRTLPGMLPAASEIVLRDFEAALMGYVSYTATTADGRSWTVGVEQPPQVVPATWLFAPFSPQNSRRVDMVTGYQAGRSSRSMVHEVIGRPDPLATLGSLGLRRGMLELWAADYPTALQLVDVHDLGEVVMLRQDRHPGMDMYYVHAGGDIDISPHQLRGGAPRWRVAVPFVEVAYPAGDRMGSLGWTFDSYATAQFDTLTADYPTFNALTQGPT